MNRLTVLRAVNRPVTSWKNLGGKTAEVAISPAGCGLEEFDWRISMASVTAPGAFSHFGNVDRTLAVISGQLGLAFEHQSEVVRLTCDSQPYQFSGEAPAVGTPISGHVVDLNLMVRRGRWSGTMERADGSEAAEITLRSHCAIIVFAGEGRARWRENNTVLQAFDAIRMDDAQNELIELESRKPIYLVSLSPIPH